MEMEEGAPPAAARDADPPATMATLANELAETARKKWDAWQGQNKSLGRWDKQDFSGVCAIHEGVAAELLRDTMRATADGRVAAVGGTQAIVFDAAMCVLAGIPGPWGGVLDRDVQGKGAWRWLIKSLGKTKAVRPDRLNHSGWLGADHSQWMEVPIKHRAAAVFEERLVAAQTAQRLRDAEQQLRCAVKELDTMVQQARRDGSFAAVPPSVAAMVSGMVDDGSSGEWQGAFAVLARQCKTREEFAKRLAELDPAIVESMVQGQCPLGKCVLTDANGVDRSGCWSAEVNDMLWKLQVKRFCTGRQFTQTAAEVLDTIPGMQGVAQALRNVNKKSGEEQGQRDLAGRALLKGDRAAQFWLARELLVR